MLKKRVQFFESYWKNSSSHIEKKSSVLCIVFFGESSILWVVFFNKNSKIQFFDSCSKKFNSLSHAQEISILWVFLKKKSILRVMLKKVQFIESCSKKGSILWVIQEKRFNSLTQFLKKRVSFFFEKKNTEKMGSILWVILQKEEGFYSFSHAQKKQFFELNSKKVQFFESVKKQLKLRRFIKEAQFYESFTKRSILWVILLKEDFDFLSLFFWHKVQYYESY